MQTGDLWSAGMQVSSCPVSLLTSALLQHKHWTRSSRELNARGKAKFVATLLIQTIQTRQTLMHSNLKPLLREFRKVQPSADKKIFNLRSVKRLKSWVVNQVRIVERCYSNNTQRSEQEQESVCSSNLVCTLPIKRLCSVSSPAPGYT